MQIRSICRKFAVRIFQAFFAVVYANVRLKSGKNIESYGN